MPYIWVIFKEKRGRVRIREFVVRWVHGTEESLAAARMVLEAASSSNVLRMLGWPISGRLRRAKTLLASMVNGDLVGVIAMIAARQLIACIQCGQLAADPALRSSITTDAAVDECLFAPTTVCTPGEAVVLLEEARSSSLSWEARAKAQRTRLTSDKSHNTNCCPKDFGCNHAEDLKLGRHVALKFLPGSVAKNPESLSRFKREARPHPR